MNGTNAANAASDLKELKKRARTAYDQMLHDRAEFEPEWLAFRRAFAPKRGRFSGTEKPRKSARRRHSRPFQVADEFAAGMKGGLTSPSIPWFTLSLFDNRFMTVEDVKVWLSQCRDIMLAVMIRSNLYDQLTEVYKEEGIFGTAALFIDEDEVEVFRARALTVGEYAIGVDSRRNVNKFSRRLRFTAEQLRDEFGDENLPDNVKRDLAEGKNGDGTQYEVYFMLWPNPDYREGAFGPRGMEYQSLWWLDGDDRHEFLRMSGYREFPAMVPRWKEIGGDIYGREHPGDVGLDDAETIQIIETASRAALLKMVDPPLLAPDDLQTTGNIDVSPGGITYYKAAPRAGAPAIVPLYQVRFDHADAENKIQNLVLSLEKSFNIDLFRMWSSDPRIGRTATEIQAREQEKMYVLGPIIERQMSQLLDPLIFRVFAILHRRGLLPKAPPELNGVVLKIEYTSVLASIQKQSAQAGIERVVQYVSNIAQIQASSGERPDIPDVIDFDEVAQQIGDMYAIPAGIVLGDDVVMQKRYERAQQQAMQQQAQMAMQAAQAAPQVTGAMKDMSETRIGDGPSALEAAMQAMGNMTGGG
jgi:hypothetical protein